MSLDLDKLRAKLESLKNPKKFKKRTWSPAPEEVNVVRLIDYPFNNSGDPFVSLHFHYGIGKGPSIVCPKFNAGTTCPICEFASSLFQSGDKESAKKLFASQRFYALMIDRKEENPEPKYWGFSRAMYEKLVGLLLSDDYATCLDPLCGLDAEIQCTKAGKSLFFTPNLTFKRKETKLAATDEQVKNILNAAVPIEQVFRPQTQQEIQERLTKWLELSEQDGQEQTKGATAEDESELSSLVSSDTVSDIDKAFSEALKD